MEQGKVKAPMGLIMSKAALIKPALRGFFIVVYSEVGTQGIEYVASLPACSSVHELAPS